MLLSAGNHSGLGTGFEIGPGAGLPAGPNLRPCFVQERLDFQYRREKEMLPGLHFQFNWKGAKTQHKLLAVLTQEPSSAHRPFPLHGAIADSF